MTNQARADTQSRPRTGRLIEVESATILREMMDSIPQLAFQVDRQGTLTYANRAWFEYTGLPSGTLGTTTLHDVMHPADRQQSLRRWRASTARGSAFESEARIRGRDGSFRWYAVRAAPARNAGGTAAAWYGTSTDIDDLRRAQRTLQHSEERLRLAQRVAGMGTWEWDIELDRVTWSQEFAALCGVADDQTIGDFTSLLERVHPDDRDRMREALGGLVATGSFATEHRIVLSNGETLWIAARGEVFRDTEGRPLRAIGVGLDISERKRSEDALRAVDQRHEMLADAGAALPGAWSPEGIAKAAVRCVVPAFADACTIELLEGGTLTSSASVSGPDAPENACAAGSEGSLRALESAQSLIVDEAGVAGIAVLRAPLTHFDRVLGVLSLCRGSGGRPFDVADRRTVRELAARIGARLDEQRVNASKDEVLALVSHELRTPLTILKGNANTLRRHGERIGAAERNEALQDIENDADRLEQIVKNMLVLAQDEGRQLNSGLEPLVLGRIVEAIVREHLQRHPVPEVILHVDAGGAMVLAHESHLRQVVTNLLSNAKKYAGNAPIEVVTSVEGDRAIIEVSDRGPGLPPGALNKVFEPFYRSASNAVQAPGVGLGLTVCRRLMTAQGGSIHAEARIGGGTSFFVSLPSIENEPGESPC